MCTMTVSLISYKCVLCFVCRFLVDVELIKKAFVEDVGVKR